MSHEQTRCAAPGGKRTDKPDAPPRKGRRMHALPLERERERGTMPRESPCEGVSIALGTTSSDFEVFWIVGERRTSSTKFDAQSPQSPGLQDPKPGRAKHYLHPTGTSYVSSCQCWMCNLFMNSK